ncbi:MAG TPA: branched-chain amino acid ABC transporter substrate-binding protein [Dialister sp.]|nr:branched-chain amino acid ABC transporter substrate-binding protein [Dialister sp.]
MMHMRKVMKTIGICSMAAIMMAGISGCGGKTGGAVSSGAKNAAKIGFTAALTGGAAAYGKSEEEGVRLAVEEINKKGNFPIDLLVEDTKAVPADSMNATKKLIQEKVSMIIGPMTSNEAKAAGPIIQNAKVPSLEISVTAENITDIGDCIFRNSVPESKNIPQTVKKTHKLLGYKTAAILYAHDNEQHVTAQKYFQKTMEEEGVQVIDVETFGSKDSEYSAQLTNVQHKAPDVIVVCSYYQEGSRILKKMREMGMDQPVLGDNGFVSPELGKMAGAAADNVYVSSMWSADRKDEKVQKFVENYTKAYGRAPDQFAASAYDGVYMAMDAMQRAGTTTDHKKIRDALAQMKDFKGVCGTFSFDEKRDPVVDLILMKMQDGKFGVVDVK